MWDSRSHKYAEICANFPFIMCVHFPFMHCIFAEVVEFFGEKRADKQKSQPDKIAKKCYEGDENSFKCGQNCRMLYRNRIYGENG